MSGCNGLCGRLAARLHSGEWEPPRYERLKPELLGALEGEVIELGPGSGVNLKHYRNDRSGGPGSSPTSSCTNVSGIGHPDSEPLFGCWPEERSASTFLTRAEDGGHNGRSVR